MPKHELDHNVFRSKNEEDHNSFNVFRSKYEKDRIAHAKRIMKPFFLRRLKAEVSPLAD